MEWSAKFNRPIKEFKLVTKSGISSVIGTGIDFLMMIFLVETTHLHPGIATFLGAVLGALTIFFLNQRWVFRADRNHTSKQLIQFFSMAGVSWLLNAGLITLLVELVKIHYILSRIFVIGFVFLCWSYPISRFVIFKKERSPEK